MLLALFSIPSFASLYLYAGHISGARCSIIGAFMLPFSNFVVCVSPVAWKSAHIQLRHLGLAAYLGKDDD
jgi:hypothetical protein